MKLGLRWPRASPYKVNCDMARIAPPVSSTERFIFPCSSAKIRRFTIFSAIAAAVADTSSRPTAISTTSPGPISPVTLPSTSTRARLTLCSTARIDFFSPGPVGTEPLVPRRSAGSRLGPAWQEIGQLRHVVSPRGHHLRALHQVGFVRLIESIGLRVVRFKILRGVLQTVKSRNARLLKRSVIAPRHPSFGQFQQAERVQWRND